jgi:hypothetical protein
MTVSTAASEHTPSFRVSECVTSPSSLETNNTKPVT